MNTKEIINTVAMYNRVMAALLECKEVNEANDYDKDLLFVECKGGTHYTNELGDIIPNDINDKDNYFFGETLEETAAKFTELCLETGCTPDDIYTMY